MADTLSIGVSGLIAFQRALDTTSHNIANASTPGYSRQRVELATRVPTFGFGTDGSGVKIAAVTRSYDEMLGVQMRTSSSSFSRLDAFAGLAESINNLFADSETGLDASLQKFSNALQSVASTPTSIPARQVLLSEASALTERLHTYDTRLQELDGQVNARVRSEADAISSIAQSIADLNGRIVSTQSASGRQPNDLLDQRSQLLSDLSAHVNVSTVAQDNGAVNVFVGNGQSLVLDNVAARIGTTADPYGAGRLNITYETAGSRIDIGSELAGGTLGGLLDAQRELIDPARNRLGQIAAGLASATNAQHAEGMDLNGNLGGNLFSVGGVQVLARAGNPGTASVAVTRTGIGALTDKDYVLQYDGTNWSMREQGTGTAVALTGAGTSGSPFLGAGLSVVVSGTPAAGAGFLVRPTVAVIDGMQSLVNDPSQFAAAAPIRTSTATTNLGSAQISAGEVLDGANAALRNTTTIQFLSANTYSLNGAGSFAYTNGGNIDLNGWRVAITGTPQTGDTFTVANNTGGVGDNRNAQALSGSLSAGLLNGGADSLDSSVGRFVGAVGVATNQAQSSRDAQKVILDDANGQIDSVSGVNLDEEAANMLRYQQAYQAAAQIIRTSQVMFDSLMAAVGR